MKKTGLFLIIIQMFIFTGLKANQVIDSLENLLPQTTDTNKVKILCDLCWEYRYISADQAFEYGKQALELSRTTGFEKGAAQSYNDMGIILIDQSRYTEALDYFGKALAIRKKLNDQPGMASLYNKMGIVYQEQGNLKSALEKQIAALNIYEELGNEKYMAYCLNNIAIIHQNLGNLDKSLDFHQKALEYRELLGDTYGIGMSYGNIANVYIKLSDTVSALSFYEKALSIFRQLENDEAISTQLSNLGNIYAANGQNQKALDLLSESLLIREKLGDRKGIASSLIKLGETQINLKQYTTASNLLYKGMHIAKDIGVVEEEMAAYINLAKLYALENNLDSAFFYTGRYIEVKDSVYDERLRQQIIDAQERYETEKMQQDMELLSKRNQLNEAELRQRNTEMWLMFFVVISVTGASIFIIYRRKQRQKANLDAALIRYKEQQLNAVLESQEMERRRIARELHDGVGQKLAGIKLRWESIADKLKTEAYYKNLNGMAGMLDEAASEVRTISHQMMPKELEQYGLVPATENMLQKNLGETSIRYTFDHIGFNSRLPSVVELNFFRITQELISNVIKHASARQLSIQMLRRNEKAVLIVEDDGKGFEVEKAASGIGMLNIESRVKAMHGQMDVESAPGEGATIRIRVPLNG